MNQRQEQLAQFGVIAMLMVFIFAVSSCERAVMMDNCQCSEQKDK